MIEILLTEPDCKSPIFKTISQYLLTNDVIGSIIFDIRIMKKVIRLLFLLIILFTCIQMVSCKRNRLKVKLSGKEASLKVVRFDRLLFENESDFNSLRSQYPRFCDLFTYKIINIGGRQDENFDTLMNLFLCDTMILNVRKMVEEQFSDFTVLERKLNRAFSYYRYHFPAKELPEIYTYISGFNQSVVTDENLIGIGLDKYLGRDCSYYNLLEVPRYKVLKMYKERIPSDVMYALAITEFDKKGDDSNLLSQMIYEGKLMYFVDAMLPETPDTVKFGYTMDQLKWCRKNEGRMWESLINSKMLYSNKRMDVIRYTGDAPSTTGFPPESPGRTGVWIGWQIVRKYMESYPDVTLPQLMNNPDYQGILNLSGYYPN